MNKLQKLRYYLAGMLTLAMVLAVALPVGAALVSKKIDVATGVTLYVDDVRLDPKDANGNPVETFVYNGTTYLPVRAIGQAFGQTVEWDAATQSVYLGKRAARTTPDVWLKDMDYFSSKDFRGGNSFRSGESDKDNLGATHANYVYGEFSRTYKLNGQYTSLAGVFYQRYEYRSSTWTSTFKVYVDGKLVYENTMAAGKEPADFNINLTGALEVEIQFDGYSSGYYFSALGDCGFYK